MKPIIKGILDGFRGIAIFVAMVVIVKCLGL